jgi:hypothetical protein
MSLCQSIDTLAMAYLDDELVAEERREVAPHAAVPPGQRPRLVLELDDPDDRLRRRHRQGACERREDCQGLEHRYLPSAAVEWGLTLGYARRRRNRQAGPVAERYCRFCHQTA